MTSKYSEFQSRLSQSTFVSLNETVLRSTFLEMLTLIGRQNEDLNSLRAEFNQFKNNQQPVDLTEMKQQVAAARSEAASAVQKAEAADKAVQVLYQPIQILQTDVEELKSRLNALSQSHEQHVRNTEAQQVALRQFANQTRTVVDEYHKEHIALAARVAALEDSALRPVAPLPKAQPVNDGSLEARVRAAEGDIQSNRGLILSMKALVDLKASREDVDAALLNKASRQQVNELAELVAGLRRDLDALRGFVSSLSGQNAGTGVTDAELAELRAAIAALQSGKADAVDVRVGLSRLDKIKVGRDELARLLATEGNITSARFRCLSCNASSAGLYTKFETPNVFPPSQPFTADVGLQSPVPGGASYAPGGGAGGFGFSRQPNPTEMTSGGRRKKKSPITGRPGSAPAARRAQSPSPSISGSGSTRIEQYNRWLSQSQQQHWEEEVPEETAAGGGVHGVQVLSASRDRNVAPKTTRRGSVVHTTEVTPEELEHFGRVNPSIGSDGRAYGGVVRPGSAGRTYTEDTDVRVNDTLEGTGEYAKGVTMARSHMEA